MRTLGVTGGIGSGKTTVCRMLEQLGARVFYADEEGKKLLVEDPSARREIVEAFGDESYLPDGSLNRGYLAERVFGSDEEIERINAIVHPRVFQRFEALRRRSARDDVPLLVKEAALIYETGGDEYLDAVAVVDAPRELRIKRVVECDEVSKDEVAARMGHQLPPEELRRRADFLITNAGDLEDLREDVARVYKAMTAQDETTGLDGTTGPDDRTSRRD